MALFGKKKVDKYFQCVIVNCLFERYKMNIEFTDNIPELVPAKTVEPPPEVCRYVDVVVEVILTIKEKKFGKITCASAAEMKEVIAAIRKHPKREKDFSYKPRFSEKAIYIFKCEWDTMKEPSHLIKNLLTTSQI